MAKHIGLDVVTEARPSVGFECAEAPTCDYGVGTVVDE